MPVPGEHSMKSKNDIGYGTVSQNRLDAGMDDGQDQKKIGAYYSFIHDRCMIDTERAGINVFPSQLGGPLQ